MNIELCSMPMRTMTTDHQPNSNVTVLVGDGDSQDASQINTVRLASNDYYFHHPLVTRSRVLWFFLSHVSFVCAFGFFRNTQLYKSTFNNNYLEIILFCVTILLHEILLLGLLFSTFDAVLRRYRAHLVWKSMGQMAVMILGSQLVQRVVLAGRQDESRRLVEYYMSSQVASVLAWLLLTADALAVVNLLRPGYHYSVLEVTATLTVHLSMESLNDLPVLSWLVISVVFVVLLVKNIVWNGVNNVHG